MLDQIQPGLLRLPIGNLPRYWHAARAAIAPGALKLEVVRAALPELRVLREPDAGQQQRQVMRSAMAPAVSPPGFDRRSAGYVPWRPPRQAEALRQLTTILQDSGLRSAQPPRPRFNARSHKSGVFHENTPGRRTAGGPADSC